MQTENKQLWTPVADGDSRLNGLWPCTNDVWQSPSPNSPTRIFSEKKTSDISWNFCVRIGGGSSIMANTCLTSPPCMTGICPPSPTISISTFSHIMQARKRPSRAIQRLQGEKRYRPLEKQNEPPNIGWFISGCVVSHQDYTVNVTSVDKH